MSRIRFNMTNNALNILSVILLVTLFMPTKWVIAVEAVEVKVYKSATCVCCKKWVSHLRDNGFKVIIEDVPNVNKIKEWQGVTPKLASCHTAIIDGYVVEGHVPADDIKRLLKERPKALGLTVPGMVTGTPGMEGPRKDKYKVLLFDAQGKTEVFSSY